MDRHAELKAKIADRRGRMPRTPGPAPHRVLLSCRWEGDIVEPCKTCSGAHRHVRECDQFGKCTWGECGKGLAVCERCDYYDPDPELLSPVSVSSVPHVPGAYRAAAWTAQSLAPGQPGARFNPSVCEDPDGDGYLLAWRDGWAGSQIWVQRRARDLTAAGRPVPLNLGHPDASYGREDPRLFVFRDRPHVFFVGVVGRRGGVSHTNQLYARLGPDLGVEQVFHPRYPGRAAWEKNWAPFARGGSLFAVYHPVGHRVIELDDGRAVLRYETAGRLPWAGGEVRGGAPPILVGNEYWHFFHDRVVTDHGLRVYRTGLYTFGADPPFAPKRICPAPLLAADPHTKPTDQYAAVCFPGGAVRRGDDWLLAVGGHDRWSEVWALPHAEIEAQLRPV